MTTHDFELLSQYLDGELSREAALSLEHRMAVEPDLRDTLDRLRPLDDAIRLAFNGTEALPAGAGALLESTEAPVATFPPRGIALWHYAMAASLVAVVVSVILSLQWRQSTMAPGPDTLLSSVLERTRSRGEGWESLEDGRRIRPVLTWANRAGSWCREYLLSDSSGNWRAVACRAQGQWVTQVATAAEPMAAANEYRPAGASDAAGAIASFMDSQAADIPLSLAEESELIAGGWR